MLYYIVFFSRRRKGERGGEPYKGRGGGCGKEFPQGWPSLEMGGVCNVAGCPGTSPAPQEKKERILHMEK